MRLVILGTGVEELFRAHSHKDTDVKTSLTYFIISIYKTYGSLEVLYNGLRVMYIYKITSMLTA